MMSELRFSAKESKPRPKPWRIESQPFSVMAPVSRPPCRIHSANVDTFLGRVRMPSRVPWAAGVSDVNMVAWEGVVRVAAATRVSKTLPPRPKRSSTKGAVSCG